MYTNGRKPRVNGRHGKDKDRQVDGESTPLTGSRHLQQKEKGVRIRPFQERIVSIAAIGAAFLALIIASVCFAVDLFGGLRNSRWDIDTTDPPTGDPSGLPPFVKDAGMKLYDELGRYVLEDYDAQPPHSNFLPALAGYYGKPLYAFYVNRGQGIASFGTYSKDYPIMEFQSANKAYQNTALVGFRTFLQVHHRRGQSFSVVEPFSTLQTRFSKDDNGGKHRNNKQSKLPKRYMYVGTNEMQLQEIDLVNGIETNVTFFVLPEEDFGAVVKRTTIRNLDSNVLTFSLLDGLAKIEPAGGKMNDLLKKMDTLEAWMGVYHPRVDSITMPFYRLSTEVSDSASVTVQVAGHWCLSVVESDEPYLLPIVYDPSKVFGHDTALIRPVYLYDKPIGDIIREPQYGFAKTASAFAAADTVTLAPGESMTISTFYGKSDNILDVPVIARRVTQRGYAQYKMSRAREIIKQITAGVETKTAIPLFDGHVQQMFLDNSLRGGIPSILGEVDDDAKMCNADEDGRLKVFHFFSRGHGDLERDYDDVLISPTFFSQV
jgi:hypothetical protein